MYQADLYIRNNDLQRRDIQKVLQNSLKLIKWTGRGDEMVLDLGCGSGDVTKDVLLANAPKIRGIVGVDVSVEMLNYARRHNAHELIQYKRMNLGGKHLDAAMMNKFHHAFSFHVIHWIKDQRRMFKNIYKMLKPGGDMLGHFVVSTDMMHIYEKQASMPRWAQYLVGVSDVFPYQHCEVPQQEIEEILNKTGFSHMVKLEKREFVYSSREHFKTSMAVINPFIKNISEDLHDEFMNDFADIAEGMHFFADHDAQNQIVIVPYIIAVIYLRKPDNF